MGRATTTKSLFLPSRSTRTFTFWSGFTLRICSISAVPALLLPAMDLPSSETMTSPSRSPAASAGPPGLTCSTRAPSLSLALSICTPSTARRSRIVVRMRSSPPMASRPSCVDSSATSCAALSRRARASSSLARVLASSASHLRPASAEVGAPDSRGLRRSRRAQRQQTHQHQMFHRRSPGIHQKLALTNWA